MHSIVEIFFAISCIEPEMLSKSDFTSNTGLAFGKIFDFVYREENNENKRLEENEDNAHKKHQAPWSNVFKLYVNTQAQLLSSLKYNFVSESIMFIGSYFEAMVQVRSQRFAKISKGIYLNKYF
jgi:hypothetical protein